MKLEGSLGSAPLREWEDWSTASDVTLGPMGRPSRDSCEDGRGMPANTRAPNQHRC